MTTTFILKIILWLNAVAFWLLVVYGAGTFLEDKRIKRWIRRNGQVNVSGERVVILPGVDWHKLSAWLKPNFCLSEIQAVVNFAKTRGREYSFYIGPDFATVERIMADKSVREVCFVGHGGAHFFKLNTTDVLCYCAFADGEKYAKEYVHQIHCGVPHGKSLIDYVVPEENRHKCFFSPGEINGNFIEAELKRLVNVV